MLKELARSLKHEERENNKVFLGNLLFIVLCAAVALVSCTIATSNPSSQQISSITALSSVNGLSSARSSSLASSIVEVSALFLPKCQGLFRVRPLIRSLADFH